MHKTYTHSELGQAMRDILVEFNQQIQKDLSPVAGDSKEALLLLIDRQTKSNVDLLNTGIEMTKLLEEILGEA